jgi:hypothetical protein
LAVDFSQLNQSCLRAFGGLFSLTHSETLITETFDGILTSGVQPEGYPPGNGSTYAKVWVDSSDFTVRPIKGDEVKNTTTVYKVVDLEEDAAGGLWLLLRYDRDVT